MKILVSRHFHDPIQNYTEIDDVDIPFHSILDQDICFVSTSVQEFLLDPSVARISSFEITLYC